MQPRNRFLTKFLTVATIAAVLAGCAHGKMGEVKKPLAKGSINKSTVILVETVNAANTEFTGDKSAEKDRIENERRVMEATYAPRIVSALKKRGFTAKAVPAGAKSGVVLSGSVTKFEHGSAAARIMVGMGAGSSNIFTNFKLTDRTAKKELADFQVIATSGGRGGLMASGSFMDAHLDDGAAKVAEYLEKSE